MPVSRAIIADLIEVACRVEQKLDPEILWLAWAHKAAWELMQTGCHLLQDELLLTQIRFKIFRRHDELQAARWYAAN